MKRIYIATSLLIVLLAGCTKFLDTEPLGGVPEENFYKNVNELSAGVVSIYDIWQSSEYENAMVILGDLPSDNFVWKDESDVSAMEIETFSTTPDNRYVKSFYKLNYQGIFRANRAIKAAPTVELILNAGNSIDYLRDYRQIYGQALFMRAFFYFKLVQAFGGVPIIPETYKIGDMATPRSTPDQVYDYIEKDLREAIYALRSEISVNSQFGQVDKWSAAGLLEKVLVFRSKPGVTGTSWEQATALGSWLIKGTDLTVGTLFPDGIDTSFYTRMKLDDSYKDLFSNPGFNLNSLYPIDGNQFNIVNNKQLNPSFITSFLDIDVQNALSNTEAILSIMHKERQTGDNLPYETGSILPAYYGGFNSSDGNCKLVPTQSLDQVMNGDPRDKYGCLSHNEPLPPEDFPDVNVGGQNGSPTFLVFVKYWVISTERPSSGSASVGRNTVLLRYADVLLLYAEALNETGNSGEAVTYLNMVRARVKLGAKAIGPYEMIRDLIWKERRIELAGEYERFFDLVRQGDIYSIMQALGSSEVMAIKKGEGARRFIRYVNEIYPIPKEEIILSNGVINQNPGY
jgi:starch-binding outer membrane protein, SusD/RagB family